MNDEYRQRMYNLLELYTRPLSQAEPVICIDEKSLQRIVSVTERRDKVDFVAVIGGLLTGAYAKARRIHLVLDDLNTHFKTCFDDVLEQRAATKLVRKVHFHYTPKHAS